MFVILLKFHRSLFYESIGQQISIDSGNSLASDRQSLPEPLRSQFMDAYTRY